MRGFQELRRIFLRKKKSILYQDSPWKFPGRNSPGNVREAEGRGSFLFFLEFSSISKKTRKPGFFPLFFCVCGSFDCSLDQPKDYPQAHSKSLNYCLLVQCLFSLIQVSVTVGKLLNFAIFNVRLFSILCSKTILVHSIRTHQIWLNASQIFSGIRCVPGTILIRSGTCTLKIMYYIIL